MGSLNALAFSEAVADNVVSLLTALSWHLTANHYPPLPGDYAEPLAEAIGLVNDGDFNAEVDVPEGVNPTPGRAFVNDDGVLVVTAADLVEACNAWAFTEEDPS